MSTTGPYSIDLGVFNAAEVVFDVPFSSLPFQPRQSDQGPECFGWPPCAAIDPQRLVALAVPSDDGIDWTLVGLDLTGRVAFRTVLSTSTRLSGPSLLMPRALGRTPSGDLVLLVSNGFDRRLNLATNYEVRIFSPVGQQLSSWTLPAGFKFFGRTQVLGEHAIGNLWISGNSGRWTAFAPGQEGAGLGASGSLDAAALVGAAEQPVIVDCFDASNAAVFRAGERPRRVPWHCPYPQSGQPVTGLGSYFGMIRPDPDQSGLLGATPLRTLMLLYLAEGWAASLAQVPLLPPRVEADDPAFVVFRDGQNVLDRDGTFYELAWQPASLRLYRYRPSRGWLEAQTQQRTAEIEDASRKRL